MRGFFCGSVRRRIGDSDLLDLEVLYRVDLGSPMDKNLESPDPGQPPSAVVHELRVYQKGKALLLDLNKPVVDAILPELEQSLIQAFQCP